MTPTQRGIEGDHAMTTDTLTDVHKAEWTTHENDTAVTLQIELGHGCAVTLTCWKNGEAPSVALWQGNGEHDFCNTSIGPGEKPASFRQWIDEVLTQNAQVATYRDDGTWEIAPTWDPRTGAPISRRRSP
jgi:hypothetical protein